MKKIFIFLLAVLAIGIAFRIAMYWYIQSIYAKPYAIVKEVVQDARDSKEVSPHILEEHKWESFSSQSIFVQLRKPIDWQEFSKQMQQCDSMLLEEGKAPLSMMMEHYQTTHKNITVRCTIWETNELIPTFLFLEKIEGTWKIVGRGN